VLDVRGSVHHSTIYEEKYNKMQQCIKILFFPIYMKLNMFRAKHCPSHVQQPSTYKKPEAGIAV
jgi:hypothetical protein